MKRLTIQQLLTTDAENYESMLEGYAIQLSRSSDIPILKRIYECCNKWVDRNRDCPLFGAVISSNLLMLATTHLGSDKTAITLSLGEKSDIPRKVIGRLDNVKYCMLQIHAGIASTDGLIEQSVHFQFAIDKTWMPSTRLPLVQSHFSWELTVWVHVWVCVCVCVCACPY